MKPEQLEEIRGVLDRAYRWGWSRSGQARDAFDALEAENKRLREALAELLGCVTYVDRWTVAITTTHTTLTRAREALKEET